MRKPERLTVEEIDQHEGFKDWSAERKQALIAFMYDFCTVLYNAHRGDHE